MEGGGYRLLGLLRLASQGGARRSQVPMAAVMGNHKLAAYTTRVQEWAAHRVFRPVTPQRDTGMAGPCHNPEDVPHPEGPSWSPGTHG